MSSDSSALKNIGVGLLVAIAVSLFMVPATIAGLPPFPQPPSLAFAELVLGTSLPLPVGLIFHLLYVTFWSWVYYTFFAEPNTFGKTLILAVVLWVVVLVVFFPLVGWGFAGLNIGSQMIVASAIPHLLFAIFLWAGGEIFSES